MELTPNFDRLSSSVLTLQLSCLQSEDQIKCNRFGIEKKYAQMVGWNRRLPYYRWIIWRFSGRAVVSRWPHLRVWCCAAAFLVIARSTAGRGRLDLEATAHNDDGLGLARVLRTRDGPSYLCNCLDHHDGPGNPQTKTYIRPKKTYSGRYCDEILKIANRVRLSPIIPKFSCEGGNWKREREVSKTPRVWLKHDQLRDN
jgi:hypothetical protein